MGPSRHRAMSSLARGELLSSAGQTGAPDIDLRPMAVVLQDDRVAPGIGREDEDFLVALGGCGRVGEVEITVVEAQVSKTGTSSRSSFDGVLYGRRETF